MDINEKRRFFGLTLKKSTWNNIIVYIVLLIVAVFWFVFPNPNTAINSGPTERLMSDTDQLTGIEFANVTYQFDGQQWQCQGPCNESTQHIEALVDRWQNLAISSTSQRPQGEATSVILFFANQNYAQVELYREPTVILRLPQQDQLFLIENATHASLTPTN